MHHIPNLVTIDDNLTWNKREKKKNNNLSEITKEKMLFTLKEK